MPVLRRPVQAAQALASIDLLSGGRLTVAVGAGFPGPLGRPLYDLSEVPWAGRFARLDETVALWRQLWTGDGPSSFHGKVLHFDAIPPVTAPYQAAAGHLARRRFAVGAGPHRPPVRRVAALPARPGRLRDRARAGAQGRPGRWPGGRRDHPRAVRVGADRRRRRQRPGRAGGLQPGELPDAARAAGDHPGCDRRAPRARGGGAWPGIIAARARHLVCRIAAPDLRSQREQLERIAGIFPLLRGGV